jgi:hypothetical protein
MHGLRVFFDSLPSIAGILLAALAFAFVFVKELDEKLKDKRAIRWCLAVMLSIIGVSAFVSDLVQKYDERIRTENAEHKQEQDMNDIRQQLQASETLRISDTRYMQGKLEVFAEFAPAIVKLAEATEFSTRKTYEAKMISNKDLYDATLRVVTKLREFSNKRHIQSDQRANQQMAAVRAAKTDGERQKVWQDQVSAITAEYEQENTQFRSTILPDAVYVRNELLRRKIPEPPPNPLHSSHEIELFFSGSLAGPYPELAAADYLEQMAKQLPLK